MCYHGIYSYFDGGDELKDPVGGGGGELKEPVQCLAYRNCNLKFHTLNSEISGQIFSVMQSCTNKV